MIHLATSTIMFPLGSFTTYIGRPITNTMIEAIIKAPGTPNANG